MTAFVIKRRRLALRLSIRGLARLLGVSPSTIQRWESGQTAPDHPEMLDLALRWLEADATKK